MSLSQIPDRSKCSAARQWGCHVQWRDEPRKPGGRQKDGVVHPFDRHAKRGHVFKRTAEKPIEFFIAGLNFCHGPQPIGKGFGVAGLRMMLGAIAWWGRMFVVIRQGIEKTCMPSFSGVERDLEAKSAICVDCLFRNAMRGNCNRSAEIAIAIGRAKLLTSCAHSVVIRPRRTILPDLTSKRSAKSQRMAISS